MKDKHRKKRRKRSRGPGERDARDGGRTREPSSAEPPSVHQKQTQQTQMDRQRRHQEALALSQQLRQLSSRKLLKECLDLYRSPANDAVRDAHHGSIVVDCCARCGDVEEAERTVHSMLTKGKNAGMNEDVVPCFWEQHKRFSYKTVPIQAWTALLKGYVHAGMMAKADSLFQYLCSTLKSKAASGTNDNRKRKKREGAENRNGPNVRTLNTLLRGCLWTATTLNPDGISDGQGSPRNKLVGGVVTAERAWSLTEGSIIRDASSYEYYISLLSQSLQCQRAEECLQKMRSEFGLPDNDLGDAKPSMLESLVVCLVVIARGYALLGNLSDGRRCADKALRCLAAADGTSTRDGLSPGASSTKKQTTGGKKSWKGAKAGEEVCADGRREESNRLFRSHRLSELKAEAQHLAKLCSDSAATDGSSVAQAMLTRLLYFSGGGTTGKGAAKADDDLVKESAKEATEQMQAQWIHSLWHSFGLREVVQKQLLGCGEGNDALKSILRGASPKKQSKKHKRQVDSLPSKLSSETCESIRSHFAGDVSVITDCSRVDFSKVFPSQQGQKLHIELGAGSGDWAALQAELNPSGNYVTVELRADRVAQTFAKCQLRQPQPLKNLCCVGSECGSFLRHRVEQGSAGTVFVNHPEPPTQTTTSNDSAGGEPAHMLNSQTILSAARCLQPNGEGRLIVVTDNVIYARLICETITRVQEEANLVGLPPRNIRDLRRIQSFGGSSIHLYEGKPCESIGHHVDQRGRAGGTSYFDRLWRTGATKHADMRKRFIIALQTAGGNDDDGGSKAKAAIHKYSGKQKSEEKKPNKKRSAEKQRRRNERRLLKKQQLAQSENT
ncbi:hypothetical protein ACHAXT_009877 [Thalassiosira profunda]